MCTWAGGSPKRSTARGEEEAAGAGREETRNRRLAATRVQRKGTEMEAPACAEGAHVEWKAGRADQVAGLRRHRKELS